MRPLVCRFLPAALAGAALLFVHAGFAPAAWAQDTTVTVQYNGDLDPTNAPDTASGTGPVGGTLTVSPTQSNYIAAGDVRTGSSLIGTVQEDPNVLLFVPFVNRTDVAARYNLGVAQEFTSVAFSLLPPASGPGTGIRFVTGGVNTGGGFDSANVVGDLSVVFFNRNGSALAPGAGFTAFFQIFAPDPGRDSQYDFGINVTPVGRPVAGTVIPEPGTGMLALAALGTLPLGTLAARRRRHIP